MKKQPFSLRRRLQSFRYALSGIGQFLIREHNAWIHLAATLVVAVLAIIYRVSHTEAIALILVIGLVWITEMLNTCLERTADLIMEEDHPEIKLIKDIAAGAVLVAAITALLVGLFIFIPRIF